MKTEYRPGTPSDRNDIVDFINYVFSQAHQPHDFKKLLPKAYGDGVQGIEGWHYLALQENRIRGNIALRPMEMKVLDTTLSVGFVGSVSVHPYARGEGHMKKLMAMMLAEAQKDGKDLLVLGGQRQRYQYFGFDTAGFCYRYHFTPRNVRHALSGADDTGIALSDVQPEDTAFIRFAKGLYDSQLLHCRRDEATFFDDCHSWNGRFIRITKCGTSIGYLQGTDSELLLTDENDLLPVIKALFREGWQEMNLAVPLWCTQRRRLLSGICEDSSITTCEMIRVLNWQKVLQAFLRLKAECVPLADGNVCLRIGEETLNIRVCKQQVTVEKTDALPETVLTPMEAQQLFFSLEGLTDTMLPPGWLPLPFWLSETDGF